MARRPGRQRARPATLRKGHICGLARLQEQRKKPPTLTSPTNLTGPSARPDASLRRANFGIGKSRPARNLLVPVDSATAIDATIGILEAESGQTPSAAACLERAKKSLPPDTFAYICSDPALKRLADEPALAGILRD